MWKAVKKNLKNKTLFTRCLYETMRQKFNTVCNSSHDAGSMSVLGFVLFSYLNFTLIILLTSLSQSKCFDIRLTVYNETLIRLRVHTAPRR